MFTTKDQDNDGTESNCAVRSKGAWWYWSCHAANLNGLYLSGPTDSSSYPTGITWYHFRGYRFSLKRTEMKIRPNT